MRDGLHARVDASELRADACFLIAVALVAEDLGLGAVATADAGQRVLVTTIAKDQRRGAVADPRAAVAALPGPPRPGLDAHAVRRALLAVGSVEDCAVLARADQRGEEQLIAYVVAPRSAPQELTARLITQVPGHLVPAAIVPVDRIPLTTSGDVYLYRGNGRGGFTGSRTLLTRGWGGYTDLVAPGDWTGDRKPDLLARKTNGELWVIAGNGSGGYTGVAPGATLEAVKVAGRNGAVDVTTILHAMHWVSAYKAQFNIRVLNLSWGTKSTQSHTIDPLNYAVQRLRKQGRGASTKRRHCSARQPAPATESQFPASFSCLTRTSASHSTRESGRYLPDLPAQLGRAIAGAPTRNLRAEDWRCRLAYRCVSGGGGGKRPNSSESRNR